MNSEEEAAALVLCSMKNSKVDYQTAVELEKTRLLILKKRKIQHQSPLAGLLSPSLAEIIGNCSTPFTKKLTDSDTKQGQVRLLLKYNYVTKFLHPLLRPSEIDKIKKRGMLVCVYDRNGRMYEMVFRLWATKAYVITTPNWFHFCTDHGLKKDLDWVTLWMFRHNVTGRICFLVTWERRGFAKPIQPVFDLSSVVRKKRTKVCNRANNLKRRRLNDDDGVISLF